MTIIIVATFATVAASGCAGVKSMLMKPAGTYQGELVCGQCDSSNALAGEAFCSSKDGKFEVQSLFKKIDTKIVLRQKGKDIDGDVILGLQNQQTGENFSDVVVTGKMDDGGIALEGSSFGRIPIDNGMPKELLSKPEWGTDKAELNLSGNSFTGIKLRGEVTLVFRALVMSKDSTLAKMKCSLDMKKRRPFGL